MNLPLVIVDPFPGGKLEVPGMIWRYPEGDLPDRECWWIVLPNDKPVEPGLPGQISWRTTDRASDPPHQLWDVSGTAPLLTVTPSIDVECWRNFPDVHERVARGEPGSYRDGSHWHGFITDGWLRSC